MMPGRAVVEGSAPAVFFTTPTVVGAATQPPATHTGAVPAGHLD